MKCIRIASGIALALLTGAAGGIAQASTTTMEAPVSLQSIRAQMSACHKVPTSYRGICKAQVNRRVDERYAALPAGSVAVGDTLAVRDGLRVGRFTPPPPPHAVSSMAPPTVRAASLADNSSFIRRSLLARAMNLRLAAA